MVELEIFSFKSDVEQSRKEAAEYKSKLSSYESQVMGLRASLQESQARSKLLAESEKRYWEEWTRICGKFSTISSNLALFHLI